MNIGICVHTAPDVAATPVVADDGKTIDRSTETRSTNVFDEYALEAALRLSEETNGETVAVAVGGDEERDALRKALALGADRAILVRTDETLDSRRIADALADVARDEAFDVVWCGKRSADFESAAVPAFLARALDRALLAGCSSFKVEGNVARAERVVAGAREILRAELPVVASAEKGLNEPRRPTLKGRMAAKKKEIAERAAPSGEPKVETVSLAPVETRRETTFFEGEDAARRLVEALKNEGVVQ
ncbi:MAG: hypothetical protein GF419_01645 [Ignavibacteriales bacterium]|nr:hypothetical protein [Ignavibacteriales bacterium]